MSAMARLSPAICLALLPMLLQGCASSVDRLNSQISRSVVTLERQQDADSLAAAALLSGNDIFGKGQKDRKHAASLIARATATAPDRADLAWLQAAICQQTPSCDALPFEVRVRTLDPSNGIGWLGGLARSWAANDDAGTNKALRAIAQSDRVDIYYTRLIAKLTPKVAEAASISLDEASVAVVGALAIESIPAYASASHACKGERLDQPDVVTLCRGVARAFENGDSFVTEMVGVAIAKRVWPENSPEWQAAVDARRLFDYQSKLWIELPDKSATESMQNHIALCSQYRREQDVFRAELIAAGKNPDLPPGP
jgi:hypothetical protein